MDSIKQLKDNLVKAIDYLKDFKYFKHLFTEDDAEIKLVSLRNTLSEISSALEFSKLKSVEFENNKPIKDDYGLDKGSLVKIRPCDDKYNNKTYLGIFLGQMALGTKVSIKDDKIVSSLSNYNPAIFVPDLNEIIFGIESYWCPLRSKEHLEQISDQDISNVWYVKALKTLSKCDDLINGDD